MSHSKRLFQIASQLDKYTNYETSELDTLIEVAESVGESWSGSWLGSESRTYNRDFQPRYFGPYTGPPETTQYSFDDVEQHINEKAGNPSIDRFSDDSKDATTAFKRAKSFALSFVYESFDTESNQFVQSWAGEIEELKIFAESDFIELQRSLNQQVSKDHAPIENNLDLFGDSEDNWNFLTRLAMKRKERNPSAIKEDMEPPPHIVVLAKALATRHPFDSCKALNEQIVKLAHHMQNIEKTVLQKNESTHQTDMPDSISSLERNSDRIEPLGELPDTPRTFGDKVFIIHGRDDGVKGDVALFVRDLGLKEIILDRQPNEGLIAILDKFEREAKKADFAIALLTPDDVGALKGEADDQLRPRARQNVIFELGYFIKALGREKVCLLLKGELENPSDLSGILYVPMDNFDGWKQKLAREMNRAKLPIDPQKLL